MKKLSLDCQVGDEVFLTYDSQQIEGTIKEIGEIFFVLDIKPEFTNLPLVGPEMGFSKDFIRELNKD